MKELSRFRYATEIAFASLELHLARLRELYISGILALAVIALCSWYTFFLPDSAFPSGKILTIQSGDSVSMIAQQLHDEGVIRSPFLFKVLMRLEGAHVSAKAGKYVFAQPIGLWNVERRVQEGIFGITATRITFVEGATVREMARTLKAAFPDFDDQGFLAEALPLEGFLFPDTYQFYPDVTEHQVVLTMYANFTEHEDTIASQVDAFGKPLRDDLIMASILEKEARTLDEKRMVAGILWNRIAKGMPLQVDAVFGYINDRPTYSPSFSDLTTDSPYNTYTNKGLPPGPIGNPGLDSLLAAVTPAKTNYLYYLTGTDGKMYYATTFAQHKLNRKDYLDN